jgi:hypothetical protein
MKHPQISILNKQKCLQKKEKPENRKAKQVLSGEVRV